MGFCDDGIARHLSHKATLTFVETIREVFVSVIGYRIHFDGCLYALGFAALDRQRLWLVSDVLSELSAFLMRLLLPSEGLFRSRMEFVARRIRLQHCSFKIMPLCAHVNFQHQKAVTMHLSTNLDSPFPKCGLKLNGRKSLSAISNEIGLEL